MMALSPPGANGPAEFTDRPSAAITLKIKLNPSQAAAGIAASMLLVQVIDPLGNARVATL